MLVLDCSIATILRVFAPLFVLLLGTPAIHASEEVWGSVKKFQEKMADSGNIEAHMKLAEMYEEGRGTEQDIDKAIEWYEDAAAHGYEPAREKIKQLQELKKQRAKENGE